MCIISYNTQSLDIVVPRSLYLRLGKLTYFILLDMAKGMLYDNFVGQGRAWWACHVGASVLCEMIFLESF